ncbi:glycoside hydrolase family 32 protein [Jeotgalibaca ciconiae]|uniref:glycoside hydrolase family 32 protein n=1 Tax=Jeotgalibaca ciconiae TaxID=2496265 RepID=UPI001582C0B4|nr:glycoside hydrolase family 32 protein [Jeotgalibaca ciconiae]HJB23320.1 glycoside hydrolase family 32 protein [Candidatus Jeotgalibaca pullicola]
MSQIIQQNYSIEEARKYIEENKDTVNTTYRHNFHVMPPIGWMNDPNGFIYYQGEYHLFYQFFPYDSKWGPMHWGHAKTKDLVHWEELPTALAPDKEYDKDGCFSGSAIEKDGKLYLMYTGHKIVDGKTYQTQCIAISEDGINFDKHANNPVIGKENMSDQADIHDFRDPKVFKKDHSYYTVIATKTEDDRGKILLYKSDDLIEWSFYSVLLEGTVEQGIMWECPDLFHLDGKDVLIMSPIQMHPNGNEYHNTSSTAVFIGEVDWESGTMRVDFYHEIDFGLDFYAPQTTIDDKGRRIMIAWMQMWGRTLPTDDLNHKWAGAMTLARELSVKDNRLIQKPVSNIYSCLENKKKLEDVVVDDNVITYQDILCENDYFYIKMNLNQAKEVRISFAENQTGSLELHFNKETEILSFSRKNFGYDITGSEARQLTYRQMHVPLVNDQLELEIFKDTSSIELFTKEGKTMTFTFYEKEKGTDLSIESKGILEINTLEYGSVIL